MVCPHLTLEIKMKTLVYPGSGLYFIEMSNGLHNLLQTPMFDLDQLRFRLCL